MLYQFIQRQMLTISISSNEVFFFLVEKKYNTVRIVRLLQHSQPIPVCNMAMYARVRTKISYNNIMREREKKS